MVFFRETEKKIKVHDVEFNLPSSNEIKKASKEAVERIQGNFRESAGLNREFNPENIDIDI